MADITTFDELIAAPIRQQVILIEVEPSIVISDWALVNGYDGVYQTSMMDAIGERKHVLAKANIWNHAGHPDDNTTAVNETNGQFNFTYKTTQIVINVAISTLTELSELINAESTGVIATISLTGSHLILTGELGEGYEITDISHNLDNFTNGTNGAFTEIQNAADGSFVNTNEASFIFNVSNVRQDSSFWYTQCSSIFECSLNQATYYYDEITKILYVQTHIFELESRNIYDGQLSSNPAINVTNVFFRLYFIYGSSKRPIVQYDIDKPIYYLPMVASIGSFTRDAGEIISPGIDSITQGSIVFGNGDTGNGYGFFDRGYYDWVWFGAQVRMLVGGESLPYSEYKLIGTFSVESIAKNFEIFTLNLTDSRLFLKRMMVGNIYRLSEHNFFSDYDNLLVTIWPENSGTYYYSKLDQGKEGTLIPIIWGHVFNVIPTCIDKPNLTYQVCNNPYFPLRAYDKSGDVKNNIQFSTTQELPFACPWELCVTGPFERSGGRDIFKNGVIAFRLTPVGELSIDVVGLPADTIIQQISCDFDGDPNPDPNPNVPGNLVSGVPCDIWVEEGFDFYGVGRYQKPLMANTWYRIVYYAGNFSITGDAGLGEPGLGGYTATITTPDGLRYWYDDRTWGDTIGYVADLTMLPGQTVMIGMTTLFKTAEAGIYHLTVTLDDGPDDYTALGMAIAATACEFGGQIVKDVYDNYVRYPYALYDSNNLQSLDALRPYPLGIVVSNAINVGVQEKPDTSKETTVEINAEAILTMISQSLFADHGINREGLLQFYPIIAPDISFDTQFYDKYDFISMNEQLLQTNLRYKIKLGYGCCLLDDSWSYVNMTYTQQGYDTDVLVTKGKYITSIEETINTNLAYKWDAEIIAQYYLIMTKEPRNIITLKARLKTLNSNIGDTICFSFPRFNKGAATPMLIRKIEENWVAGEVTLTLIT